LKSPIHKSSGFSMLEILVVLAVMVLLATLVVPNVRGFISTGKDKAWNGDRESLQLAVDGWRNTVGKTEGPKFPILQCQPVSNTGVKCVDSGKVGSDFSENCLGKIDDLGVPTAVSGVASGDKFVTVFCNPYVDVRALAVEGFLAQAASVKSSNTELNATAINSPSGSYGWYVGVDGLMRSFPPFTKNLYP